MGNVQPALRELFSRKSDLSESGLSIDSNRGVSLLQRKLIWEKYFKVELGI